MNKIEVSESEVNAFFDKLEKETKKSGYHLNPDNKFTKALLRSLLVNEKRYGYQVCPCRLATKVKSEDLDIICPCDYRDADLKEFDTCFCGLYVSGDVLAGKKQAGSIAERRPPKNERSKEDKEVNTMAKENVKINPSKVPVWRCKVCGYLCARDAPPDECPICHVGKERFERFM